MIFGRISHTFPLYLIELAIWLKPILVATQPSCEVCGGPHVYGCWQTLLELRTIELLRAVVGVHGVVPLVLGSVKLQVDFLLFLREVYAVSREVLLSYCYVEAVSGGRVVYGLFDKNGFEHLRCSLCSLNSLHGSKLIVEIAYH